jgi:hypothetical protein
VTLSSIRSLSSFFLELLRILWRSFRDLRRVGTPKGQS